MKLINITGRKIKDTLVNDQYVPTGFSIIITYDPAGYKVPRFDQLLTSVLVSSRRYCRAKLKILKRQGYKGKIVKTGVIIFMNFIYVFCMNQKFDDPYWLRPVHTRSEALMYMKNLRLEAKGL